MKNYEITDRHGEIIISYFEGTRRISFIADETNAKYQEYLRYTAWVEAGNTPEDFWNQDDGMLELSEPKEEETTEQPSSTDTKIETDLGE